MFNFVMRSFFLKYYTFFPVVGLGLYLVSFSFAAFSYPGGSFNEPHARAFSFFHNFLCDVMDPSTKGGVFNSIRPLAIVSHLVLSFAMISFFYLLPEIFTTRSTNFFLVRWFGILSMVVFVFMFTSFHDRIVTLTGILGTFALIPFFLELRTYANKALIAWAYMCFGLSIVVFFSFETKIGFYYLPLLQKITFAFDAIWVIWVSSLVRTINNSNA